MKRCASCGTEKPRCDFGLRTLAKDGLQSYCRECSRARRRAWGAANAARVAAYNRTWREQNPEAALKATVNWRSRNGERVRSTKREWERRHSRRRQEDPERRAARLAAWKAVNRERVREYQQRRRAAGYGAPLASVDLVELHRRARDLCGICGDHLDAQQWPHPRSTSVDHIVPLSRGGSHALDNLQLAHLGCNLKKGARMGAAPAWEETA